MYAGSIPTPASNNLGAKMTWTIIGTAIALAGLHVGLFAWLRSDMKDLAKALGKLDDRMAAVETEQGGSAGLVERVEKRLDGLSRDLQQVARDLSELRGEVRGRLSVQSSPAAPDTGIPSGRVVPHTARGPQG